jgi:hypothetical protein
LARVFEEMVDRYALTVEQAKRVRGGSFLTRDLSGARRVGIVASLAVGAAKGQAAEFYSCSYGTVDEAIGKLPGNPGAMLIAEEIAGLVLQEVEGR